MLFAGTLSDFGQSLPPTGSLEVSGRVRIEKSTEKLSRKRFYLLPGGRAENEGLVERLRSAETVSRDCFYTKAQASPQFICWLKQENCESPYCRTVTETDIDTVPEFRSAFQKGLRQFGRSRPAIARDWLTTNLPTVLREGFYQRQKSLLETILGDLSPLQSAMTDSVSVKAIFIDIPLKSTGPENKDPEKFFVSNLLPLELDGKSYIWACEVEISPDKTAKLILRDRDCEVIVKDLPVCQTGSCEK